MDISAKIRATRAALGVSEAELARAIGTSPQNLFQRMKIGKFTTSELEQIAEVRGVKYVAYFELQDGTKI